MSTYRERRMAKAERLRGWAEKREARSDATLAESRAMMDAIPFGQPILVGHHSERRDRNYRDRAWNKMGRGVEHARKAESMRRRADNIEAAAEHAIYSDDEDAVERLRERIAELEAERARIVAYNKTARKGEADESLLDEKQRRDLALHRKHSPAFYERKRGQFPSYALSNLSGNISRLKKRLAQLEA